MPIAPSSTSSATISVPSALQGYIVEVDDDHEIEIHGYNIELWCENDHIVNICCRESCIS